MNELFPSIFINAAGQRFAWSYFPGANDPNPSTRTLNVKPLGVDDRKSKVFSLTIQLPPVGADLALCSLCIDETTRLFIAGITSYLWQWNVIREDGPSVCV